MSHYRGNFHHTKQVSLHQSNQHESHIVTHIYIAAKTFHIFLTNLITIRVTPCWSRVLRLANWFLIYINGAVMASKSRQRRLACLRWTNMTLKHRTIMPWRCIDTYPLWQDCEEITYRWLYTPACSYVCDHIVSPWMYISECRLVYRCLESGRKWIEQLQPSKHHH